MAVDKKGNFIRIAEARTNKTIESIRLLGNLSNSSYYEYAPAQIEAIFTAIQEEIETQKKRFADSGSKKKKFRL